MHFVSHNFNGKRENETFVGNVVTQAGIPFYLSKLSTVRLGGLALDINGKMLRPSEYLPMFIANSEMEKYNRIMVNMLSAIRSS